MRAHALTVLLVLLAASSARAQDNDENLRRAVVLFEESEVLYNQGELAQAVALLERAYALHPNATLLFNLGRAQEGLGELDDAIESYSRYLAEADDVPDRGAIERRVQTLREQRARLNAPAEPEQTASTADELAPQTSAPEASVSIEPAPWIVAGLGAAVLGAAIGVGVFSQDEAAAAHAEPVQELAVARHADAEALAITADVLFGVGGALALAGCIWGIVSLTALGEPAVEASVGPGGVQVRGRF